jgi:hypothetical protein
MSGRREISSGCPPRKNPPFRPPNIESTEYLVLVFESFRSIPYQLGGLTCDNPFAVPVEEVVQTARPVESKLSSFVEGEVV